MRLTCRQGGYLAVNIANQNLLPGWLSSTKPDIVVMHVSLFLTQRAASAADKHLKLGTNDVWNNQSPATITTAFSKLVDQMRAAKPTMKILVAKIIPMNPSGCSECGQRVINLNNAIVTWAPTKSTSTSPITVVDVWTGFNTATMTGDGVHPNDAGAKVLANSWYSAVAAAIKSS